MTDLSVFTWINGLAGRTAFFDELFKGLANDYFVFIAACLVMIALWFGGRDAAVRERNQRGVINAMIAAGFASALVVICNAFYFRPRPFDGPAADTMNLLFYRPTDSSFPSHFAAVIFGIAIAVFLKNRRAGSILLALAILGSFGRIFVGIHYPLDSLGGLAFGVLAAFGAAGITKVLHPVVDYTLAWLRRCYLA